MKKKYSLRSQLIMILLLFVVGVMALVYFVQTTFLDDFYKANKVKSLQSVGNSIADIIADDVPEVAPEKTLEELLETMTPLGEDAEKTDDATTETDGSVKTTTDTPVTDTEDTDVALEKLATEFFENQDKIETPIKPAGRGKIGKLKNILPFKKAKREDSGLMGDLFGWAGVAANDDDFTMPGFLK